MTAPTAERNLLDLHMNVDPDGSAAAVAPLSWCVTKTLLEKVEHFKNPHMLIINRVKTKVPDYLGGHVLDYRDKWAKCVPLANAMQYLSFSEPGENELHAFVIDIGSRDDSRYMRTWLDEHKERVMWDRHSAVCDDGTLRQGLYLSTMKNTSEMLVVNVPKEMFAPPPAPWKKSVVSAFFSGKQVDQCHFRKHLLISLAFSAVVVPINYLTKTVITVGAYSLSIRGYNFNVFKHPLQKPSALWDSSSKTWVAAFENREGKEGPSVWSVLNAFSLMLLWFLYLLLDLMGWGAVGIAMLGLVTFAIAFVATGSYYKSDGAKAKRLQREKEREEKERIRSHRVLKSIVCETNLPAASVKDLPKELQTVELRFNAFKTKVCKPFAR